MSEVNGKETEMVNTKKLPTVDGWAPNPSLIQGGPFMALGCGDAWCVLDSTGHLAWANETQRSIFADQTVAEKVAGIWNKEI